MGSTVTVPIPTPLATTTNRRRPHHLDYTIHHHTTYYSLVQLQLQPYPT